MSDQLGSSGAGGLGGGAAAALALTGAWEGYWWIVAAGVALVVIGAIVAKVAQRA